jgi:hypothetical protein
VHDFEDKQLGKVVPYGIYDVTANAGFVRLGITADTAEFAVRSIRCRLERMGRERYPTANELTVTADCGGSNGARVRLWKLELQRLADETGLILHVHHYPPGTSKWNKIEHRLFCRITQNWRGRPLESRLAVVELIGATTTKAGLIVECELDTRTYHKGVKVSDAQMAPQHHRRRLSSAVELHHHPEKLIAVILRGVLSHLPNAEAAHWQDGNDYGIYQQRYDRDGVAVDVETRVNKYTTSDQFDAGVTSLADGGWLVTWSSLDQDSSDYGIYQQRYDFHGAQVGDEKRVNSQKQDSQSNSSTIALVDGGWLVTWTSAGQEGNNTGIYQQRYDADGIKAGGEVHVNSYTNHNQERSSAIALADGGWVVTWVSDKQDGSGLGIYQQRFDETGDTVGEETIVNTFTKSDQESPAIAVLRDGGWVLSWASSGPIKEGRGICQQRYNAEGDEVGSQTLVKGATTLVQNYSDVTGLADGGWVVTWLGADIDPGSLGFNISQQRYDAEGNAVGTETKVDTGFGESFSAAITALPDGGWEVTWTTLDGRGNNYNILQRHFATDISGSEGADRLSGTGWDETLLGFGGNDRLNGRRGDDILIGGLGDDIYFVNSRGDDVQELTAQGTETVFSSVTFDLRAHSAVEHLTLTDKGKIDANGNAGGNELTGNAAANVIKGFGGNDQLTGGKGQDVLVGGAGTDSFVFATGSGGDTIRDFDAVGADHDLIDLGGMKAIKNFDDLKAHHLKADGTSVLINAGHGDTITLEAVKIKDLQATDFQF